MKKIKDEDMLCCSDCGSTRIIEKCWIFINDVVVLNGECYQRVDEPAGNDTVFCKDCYDECYTDNLQEWKDNNPKR